MSVNITHMNSICDPRNPQKRLLRVLVVPYGADRGSWIVVRWPKNKSWQVATIAQIKQVGASVAVDVVPGIYKRERLRRS